MTRSVPERQDAVHLLDVDEDPRTPAGDALSGLWVRVFLLNGLFSAAGDALARPAGQTSARWQVMASVEDAPATVSEIARRLRLARQSVQRVADLLEREGLASFVDNPRHRRAKLFELNAEGRRVLATVKRAQRPWADRLGTEIGEADLLAASAVLDRVLEALTHPARRPPPRRT